MIEYTDKGAILSTDGRYRYLLWRTWDAARPHMLWIMLNPSTADADQDDATIRVCAGRALRLGHGGIEVVNLFALRATNPQELYRAEHPISDPADPGRNDWQIKDLLYRDRIVCAWGDHGALHGRSAAVLNMLRRTEAIPYALRLTKAGHPGHPLRVPYSQPLLPM